MNKDSKYDPEWTAAFYDEYADKEWHRFMKTPSDRVNHAIHEHYIRTFVAPGSSVLEIGAGPGRFTKTLSELNCRVTVSDISEVQLGLHEKYSRELGFDGAVERRLVLDICNLQSLDADAFDAVIAYGGPLSYVFDHAQLALDECVRVCKPGGHVLASVMSLWGTCHKFLEGILEIPAEYNRTITDTGDLHPEIWDGVGHRCHMFTASELRQLFENSALAVHALSAANCISINHDDALSELDEDSEKWKELLRMELEACAASGCLDMGTHIIAVGQK